MEKEIKIKTKDNHIIYGILNAAKKTKNLVIFVHGLTGHPNEHLFYNAVPFFNIKNYTTFRVALYSSEKKARTLTDCTLTTHTEDLNCVLNYFKKKYSKIFLVGHSFGGPTILHATLTAVSGIVLWDPSINIGRKSFLSEFSYLPKIKKYVVNWGTQHIIGTKMYEEFSYKGKYKNLARNFKTPLNIILAGNGILKKDWKKEITYFSCPTELVLIKGATHCFDEEGVEKKLFSETLRWIDKW